MHPADSLPMHDAIELRGVATHNLKKIDVQIPHRAMTVISGVSGSGKSSLAFDTLYAEGQRRFLESLSTYARQFLQRMEKPPVELVRHLLPAVALEQKNSIRHGRSTVATLTELADHLQLLYAHVGVTTCPACREVVRKDTPEAVAADLEAMGEGRRLLLLADVPVVAPQTPQHLLEVLAAQGHQRLWWEGEAKRMDEIDPDKLLSQQVFSVVVDRLKIKQGDALRLREAIEGAFKLGDGKIRVLDVTQAPYTERRFHATFSCNGCGRVFVEPTPSMFSFNSPLGACPACSGFGKVSGIDMNKVVPDRGLTLERGAIAPFELPSQQKRKERLLERAAAQAIPIDVPFGRLREEDQQWILKGGKGFVGVQGFFDYLAEHKHKPHYRIMLAKYRGYTLCPDCQGQRFGEAVRCVTVEGRSFAQVCLMTLREAREVFDALALSPEALRRVAPVLAELRARLHYLDRVGLGYLTLDRPSRTLSGGEVQRIHLTASLGRMLTDTLYVLDEPTAGLHARDTERLLQVLRGLRDIGNAVVIVEHDPEVIRAADWVLELGPTGGEGGGRVLFQGTPTQLTSAPTPTGASLKGRAKMSPPKVRPFAPGFDPFLEVFGARENNLKELSVKIPLQRLVCITGVSGSGKSTLVHRCLHDAWRQARGEEVEPPLVDRVEGFGLFGEMVVMRQGGPARSSRSNLATATEAWNPIRKLFGELREALDVGLGPGDFSFNRAGGRCEKCEGTGTLTVEMHFMADLEVPCEECQGKRFQEKVLGVRYRDRNIHEVLQMTVAQAIAFFQGHTPIVHRLQPLVEVGLDYLRLGQTTATLSGGEAQRMALAGYLGRKHSQGAKDRMLFLFDEPTVGLHLKDIDVLLKALRRVVAEGHSVIVVEHNTDLIAQADHVIDLGPEGGDAGGSLVAQGTPAEVAAVPQSWTGRFLAELFHGGLDAAG